MAGQDSMSSKGKANEEIYIPTFSAENMQSNMKIIYYSRTFMSIIGGVMAGILGFTGLSGFILYFVLMTITSIGLVAKTGFSVNSYFGSWNQIVVDGFLGGLMWVFPVTNPRMMKFSSKVMSFLTTTLLTLLLEDYT